MASEKEKAGALPIEDRNDDDDVQPSGDRVARVATADRILQGAKLATQKEQSMTLLQGIKLYPKAIAWSMLISTCIVMEGYDVCLINNFCGFFHHLTPPLKTKIT